MKVKSMARDRSSVVSFPSSLPSASRFNLDMNMQVIRTPDQRVRVFISSTLQELAEERAAARQAVSRMRLTPVMFELGARPHPPRELYRAYLEQSHIFVGIYWRRYGWVAPDMTISGLEDEYVLSEGMPRLIYMKEPALDREPRLQELIARIESEGTSSYKPFTTPDELRELLANDLAMLLTESFATAQLVFAAQEGRIGAEAGAGAGAGAPGISAEAIAVAPGGKREIPNNLPVYRSALIGRAREQAALNELLLRSDVGVVTLTGPGGSGKSRLALKAASDLMEKFEDGVFFVSLASVNDPSLVVAAVARTLAIRETSGQDLVDSLKDYLRNKRTLLLLDNFEQIVEAAPLVSDLLDSALGLKVLVTSRIPLHLRDEREFPVPSMQLPPASQKQAAPLPLEALGQYEAVELFVSRARDVRPDFTLDDSNATAVVEICRRLDGLPLAIELAAARTKVLTPQALLSRLGSSLQLLTGGARDLPARQQTLRNTISWSYDLLDETEKALFRRLSVFRGGSSLEAIESVCTAPEGEATGRSWGLDSQLLDGIASLVDKSLFVEQEQAIGDVRFIMLATIREYGLELLLASGEGETIRHRHARYYADLAQRAEREMTGHEQPVWLDTLEIEHDNLREALRYAVDSKDAELALTIAGSLWRFWYIRGYYTEGHEWLADALALTLSDERTALRANALKGAGNLAYMQGNYKESQALQEESLSIAQELGDTETVAALSNNLGYLARHRGEYAKARSLHEQGLKLSREVGSLTLTALNLDNLGILAHDEGDFSLAREREEESLAIYSELGDEWGTAMVLNDLGHTVFQQGDYPVARSLYERSLALQEKLGDRAGAAAALNYLGLVALNQSDYPLARAQLDESLAVFRNLGHKRGTADALHNLGKLVYRQGDYAGAYSYFQESLALRKELDDRQAIAESLNNLGLVALARGDYTSAWDRLQESLALWRETGNKADVPTSLNNLGLVAAVQGEYKKARALLEESRELFEASGEKLGMAFALLNLGLAVGGEGDSEAARAYYKQSLQLFSELGDKLHVATCLVRMAALDAATGRPERAARLAGAAEELLGTMGSPLPSFEHQYYRPAMHGARAQMGDQEFLAAYAEGEAMSMEEATAYALE